MRRMCDAHPGTLRYTHGSMESLRRLWILCRDVEHVNGCIGFVNLESALHHRSAYRHCPQVTTGALARLR
eukprot:2327441-Pleurochrysis_carterae.AAC.1